MIQCYRQKIKTYNNNILINERSYNYFLCESTRKPEDGEVILTWNNVTEMYKLHGLKCDFILWNTKKGRLISFFNFNIFKKETWDIKEWKQELNLLVTWRYEEYNPSIDDILKYPDLKKAMKYLKERSMI